MRVVPISDLQSDQYWLGTTLIREMSATHLQNSLRMLRRDPIGTLHGVQTAIARQHALTTHEVSIPFTPLPVAERLVHKWQLRQAVNEVADTLPDNERSSMLISVIDLPSADEIETRALRWIIKQPTYKAMRRRLIWMIEHGEANVNDVDPEDFSDRTPL